MHDGTPAAPESTSTWSDEMAYDASPIPWTDDQWARIENVIQQEARSARVAASFLPLFGPLPPDTDFVRRRDDHRAACPRSSRRRTRLRSRSIDDTETVQLATLQVEVGLRGPQIADPELSSALQLVPPRSERARATRGPRGVQRVWSADAAPPAGSRRGRSPCAAHAEAPRRRRAIWQITGGEPTRRAVVRARRTDPAP